MGHGATGTRGQCGGTAAERVVQYDRDILRAHKGRTLSRGRYRPTGTEVLEKTLDYWTVRTVDYRQSLREGRRSS